MSKAAKTSARHVADRHDLIRVRGARVNNLKDVSIEIPKRRLTVFTGVSGSGKSSLVFATIAAESQRLINETYSSFVQGFMPTMARPDVDLLDGLTTLPSTPCPGSSAPPNSRSECDSQRRIPTGRPWPRPRRYCLPSNSNANAGVNDVEYLGMESMPELDPGAIVRVLNRHGVKYVIIGGIAAHPRESYVTHRHEHRGGPRLASVVVNRGGPQE